MKTALVVILVIAMATTALGEPPRPARRLDAKFSQALIQAAHAGRWA